MSRFMIGLLLLGGCGEIDVSDLDENPRPSATLRCDHEIQASGRLFTIEEYSAELARCLHGTATPEDGGVRD